MPDAKYGRLFTEADVRTMIVSAAADGMNGTIDVPPDEYARRVIRNRDDTGLMQAERGYSRDEVLRLLGTARSVYRDPREPPPDEWAQTMLATYDAQGTGVSDMMPGPRLTSEQAARIEAYRQQGFFVIQEVGTPPAPGVRAGAFELRVEGRDGCVLGRRTLGIDTPTDTVLDVVDEIIAKGA